MVGVLPEEVGHPEAAVAVSQAAVGVLEAGEARVPGKPRKLTIAEL